MAGRHHLGQRQLRLQPHRRHQPEPLRSGDLRDRGQPEDRQPGPDQVEVHGRVRQGRGGVRQVTHLQVRPGSLGERDGLGEGGPLGQHGRVVGRVGPGQVRPDPDHLEHALGLRGHRSSQQRRQLAGRHAAAPQAGVHLHVHPSGAARRAYGVQHLTERPRPAHRHVDVGLEQLVEGRLGGVQPGQHAGRDAAGAQLERLGRLRDAEPGGAAGQSRPGARQQPVPVAVRLDHCHHLGGGGVPGQRGDVRADGGEVDHCLGGGSHDGQSSTRWSGHRGSEPGGQ